MFDLTVVGAPRLMADQIKADVEAAGTKPGRYSWRVKASQLAGDCLARQWYGFRWARKLPISATLNRIFEFGKGREDVFVAHLRDAGWEIVDKDPTRLHTNFPQFQVKDIHGHLSAYLDGVGRHPNYSGENYWLVEFKTMNKKKFAMLESKQSIRAISSEYYGQVCIYMHKMNLPYTLLMVECKDNQEYYYEIIPANSAHAVQLIEYGETIAHNTIRPARVAESPAYHVCKMCDFMNICHYAAPVDRNCRSCVMCAAADDGKFYCERWSALIPNEKAILEACEHHEPIQ